ncbi:MAG: CPBP family intramembrane metalloprotease [Ruminiclostridium sp.]|nr:CPBP family intramembrane metalloprotease [Ruminiclostridium sp.]
MPAYRKSALLVGTYIMICFVLRYIAVFVVNIVYSSLNGSVMPDTIYIIELCISGLMLQILPSIIGAFMFRRLGKNGKGIRTLYTIPKSNTRAIGNLPAVYGLGQAVNIITIIVTFLLTDRADPTRQLNTVSEMASTSPARALFMFFMLVVIAPVFEEFMFRGLIMDELKPYGNGFAIFTTGILFGLFHGNITQGLYTMAMGIALGYIANVTGSIFPTTIIHAILNSLGGIMILLMSTHGVQTFFLSGMDGDIPDEDMIWLAIFGIFMISLFIFIGIGLISAILKIKQIKRYKVPKVCPGISNGKKAAMLIFTVPAILAIIMIVDTFCGFSSGLIASLIGGGA